MLQFNEQPFGVNLGLGDSFKAQTEGAELAKYMTDEQFKNLMAVQDPSDNLAIQRAAANSAANTPQLRFDGNNFAEGVGNGISNFYAMKGYKQQQQAYKDIATQQQAYQQKRLGLANQQIAGQQREIETGNQQLPVLLPTANPEQITALQAANRASGGKLFTDLGTRLGQGYTDIGLTDPKTQAESKAKLSAEQDKLNWQRERFTALTGVPPEKLFAMGNQGALTPQMQSAWKYVYGSDPPKDALDFKQRFAQVASAVEGARGATIDNDTRGQRNQAGLDSTLLGNQHQQIVNQLEQLKAEYEPDRLASEADARHYNDTERAKKAQDAQGVLQIVDDTLKKIESGSLTDSELVAAQVRLKALGAGDALAPIVDAYQPKAVGKTAYQGGTVGTTAVNANKAGKEKDAKLVETGWQKHPSGWLYNPTTGEFKAP